MAIRAATQEESYEADTLSVWLFATERKKQATHGLGFPLSRDPTRWKEKTLQHSSRNSSGLSHRVSGLEGRRSTSACRQFQSNQGPIRHFRDTRGSLRLGSLATTFFHQGLVSIHAQDASPAAMVGAFVDGDGGGPLHDR